MSPDDPDARTSDGDLPSGSLVPGADIWDDDEGDSTTYRDDPVAPIRSAQPAEQTDNSEGLDDLDDQIWLHDAQIVAHAEDPGPHDGSRGVEADDDSTSEAFGTKVHRWAGSSVMGASLAGMGLAIDKVLFDRDPTQIEIQAEDDADGHLDPIEVNLDTDHPEMSVAVLRPWLRDQSGTDPTLEG